MMDFDSDNHSFTFRFDSNEGERTLEMNCNSLFLQDILDQFRDFLQGCGYIVDGQLEVVPYDGLEYVVNTEKENYQASFDFSNIPNNNWPFAPSTTSYAWDSEPDSKKVYSPYVPTSDK